MSNHRRPFRGVSGLALRDVLLRAALPGVAAWIAGRCDRCRTAYYWRVGTLRLAEARCPHDRRALKAVKHAQSALPWVRLQGRPA